MLEKLNVSTITVCYNSYKTIIETIESVLNQLYSNVEYIVIDANSFDTSIDILKSYETIFKEKKIVYKWIDESVKRGYDVMNKGLILSTIYCTLSLLFTMPIQAKGKLMELERINEVKSKVNIIC